MRQVFNAILTGKTNDPFVHDRKFEELNQDQKYAYILILTSMWLQIPDIIMLLGAAGTGKSEAIKIL
jgi:predicted ATPase